MTDELHEEILSEYRLLKKIMEIYRKPNEEICETYKLEKDGIYSFMTGMLGSNLEQIERKFEEWLKL